MFFYIRIGIVTILLVALALAVSVCDPEGDEPARVELPVEASGAGLDVCVNDTGWTVTVTTFRLAVSNLEFTLEGEVHEAKLHRVSNWIAPEALAHPGHLGGGDVTGELPGNFLLNLTSGANQPLGLATIIVGEYFGTNFYFRRAAIEDGIASDDPIVGHTAYMEGLASKDGIEIAFTAQIDMEDGKQMVGAPFELMVEESTVATLVVRMLTNDPSEVGETFFDRLDFGTLDTDEDGSVVILPGEAAHNVIMKTLERHDHFDVDVI